MLSFKYWYTEKLVQYNDAMQIQVRLYMHSTVIPTLFWFVLASYVYRWDTHAKSNSHSGIRYVFTFLLVCTERQVTSYIHTYSYLDEFYVAQERRGNTSRINLEICEWLSILPFLKHDGSTKHSG